jgi:hypothetical protein
MLVELCLGRKLICLAGRKWRVITTRLRDAALRCLAICVGFVDVHVAQFTVNVSHQQLCTAILWHWHTCAHVLPELPY